LAVEYAGKGQDEEELQEKSADMLAHGTKLIWVVRLLGPKPAVVRASGQLILERGDVPQVKDFGGCDASSRLWISWRRQVSAVSQVMGVAS
jgi:hypothetical protein